MISVVVGTFGDPEWREKARCAGESAKGALEVIYSHDTTLANARNGGGMRAKGEWICFLDADDELGDGYIQHMEEAARSVEGPALIQPATRYVMDGVVRKSDHLIPAKESILTSNWMVIGTLVRRDQFMRVRGFQEFPIYEDWDLWIRCIRDGAALLTQPKSVYVVHERANSRNNQPPEEQMRWYKEIRSQYV